MQQDAEQQALSEEYLDNLLEKYSDLGPKVDAMKETDAEARIRMEIAKFDGERQRAGLWSINKVLKQENVPPSVRLHLVTATVHLSLLAKKHRADGGGEGQP